MAIGPVFAVADTLAMARARPTHGGKGRLGSLPADRSRLSLPIPVAVAALALTLEANGNSVAPALPRDRARGTVVLPELISVRARPVPDRAKGVAVVVARDRRMSRAIAGCSPKSRRAQGAPKWRLEGPTRALRPAADGARSMKIDAYR